MFCKAFVDSIKILGLEIVKKVVLKHNAICVKLGNFAIDFLLSFRFVDDSKSVTKDSTRIELFI